VSGALTERDFVHKLEKAGFEEVEVVERTPMGVPDCALYPLFTEDLLELMRTLIPPERQERVATAIVLRARRAT
jgi:arsenite methyltransferase